MKINIKATNLKLTPSIEDFVEEKIGSLEKFTHGILEAIVEVGKTTNHHKSGPFFRAEADLVLPGKVLRAEAEEKDLYIAITRVKDELQTEVKKYKEKMIARRKRGARTAKRIFKIAEEAQSAGDKDLSRRQINKGI
jgi:putative sigma-54 modulation protein